MSKGYLFAFVKVHDPAHFNVYQEAAASVLKNHPGKLLVKCPTPSIPESVNGIAGGSAAVVIEFESFEAATAFYESEEYQSAIKLREPYSDATFLLAPGLE